MNRTRFHSCLIAAAITLAGATHLARPAQAAEAFGECSDTQKAYAAGYAAGSCGGGGSVDSCESYSNGGFSFVVSCEPT